MTEKITSKMKLLTVDIGTGTQDVYLFNSELSIENGYKMILPSPTLMIQRKLHHAAREQKDVLLTGHLMGGGPCGWGVTDHIKNGLKVYATKEAALTFDDNLDSVQAYGVILLSDDEADKLPAAVQRIEMGDFDFHAIEQAFKPFGVRLDDLAAIALAVFDHGNAPLDVSDRKFRFDYLDKRIHEKNALSAFAYKGIHIPSFLTRLRSAADCAKDLAPELIVMDTAPAAILGATLDPMFLHHERNLMVNVGNLHTLGFRLGAGGIEGVFEHHTGFLDRARLEELLLQFASGELTNEEVYNHHGHGALICDPSPLQMDHEDFNLIATGPRRGLLAGSPLRPYFAAPYGDMMICGCFGLLRAAADLLPDYAEPILTALNGKSAPRSPWELP